MGYYGSNAYKDYIPQNNVNRNYDTINKRYTENYSRQNRTQTATKIADVNTVKKPQSRTVKKSVTKKRANANTAANKFKNLRRICVILILALSAGFMVSKFVTVHELRKDVQELQRQLAKEEAISSQKIFDLESSVDLSEIEDEAYKRLNMQRPEKYQIVYVNVPYDDVTDTTADEVEGVVNNAKAFFANIWKHIVDTFSIK